MANVTDPIANQLSGSDPQNLMEYITRQKIYDSRYWKEECFGLTVANVLEKCVSLPCLGVLPGGLRCLALTLKLLQLQPEFALVHSAFVAQAAFKYVRAVGCLYLRLTSRPVEIYAALEPLYADYRPLRVYAASNSWRLTTVDQFVHELLAPPAASAPRGNCLGLALPRLPARRVLQEAGFLPEGPRATALHDVILEHSGDGDGRSNGHPVLNCLRHMALVEKIPAAIVAWNARQRHGRRSAGGLTDNDAATADPTIFAVGAIAAAAAPVSGGGEGDGADDDKARPAPPRENPAKAREAGSRKRIKQKLDRPSYGTLFKTKAATTTAAAVAGPRPAPEPTPAPAEPAAEKEDYWNAERARLGLGKLK